MSGRTEDFNDARGWWRAVIRDAGRYKWGFRHRPVLYYPAELEYTPGPQYFAVDGLGRTTSDGNQMYECTISPETGKFERLCVQTRDSLCRLDNSTWDRTIIRNTSPVELRVSAFPMHGFSSHGRKRGGMARPILSALKAATDLGNEQTSDTTPYIFISYSHEQFFGRNGDKNNDEQFDELISYVLKGLIELHGDAQSAEPKAFWIDVECLAEETFDQNTGTLQKVANSRARQELKDHDIYTISDVIRGAEQTMVLASTPSTSQDADFDQVWWKRHAAEALQGWGGRVWTLPEVLLSKGSTVTAVLVMGRRRRVRLHVDKLRLAELAWDDADTARQLVEHFTTLPLSRLELVRAAVQCIHRRSMNPYLPGDRSYALMGLLRIRPPIDCTDSAFGAFARLSLPQDSDRLMERLICLLPRSREETWEDMSDQYHASLWDVYPSTQICGLGENDTVIVDGFQGAMIEWAKFASVHTFNRMTVARILILSFVKLVPMVLLLISCIARSWATYYQSSAVGGDPADLARADALARGYSVESVLFLLMWLGVSLTLPWCYRRFYGGKLRQTEPYLFGVEGYVPLEDIEEKLFGLRLDRLSWSPNGSPLSRHAVREGCESGCRELRTADSLDIGISERADLESLIHTYPFSGVDPLAPCNNCTRAPNCGHEPPVSAEAKSKSTYGDMKIFTLVDTASMTVTLFEAARPPVALLVGGSEGGMQRAIACSYDVTTGTMYRETVLRMPSSSLDHMHTLPRVRLGLKNQRKMGQFPGEAAPVRNSSTRRIQLQPKRAVAKDVESGSTTTLVSEWEEVRISATPYKS
ncbi:hypothetical protein F4778DRAFT_780839 [Xylariomycetidae sp. FL2044]|nr:hypothetical protein F4778DRAFT_780839 [Xylariomycetidae sp. FL2044]